MLEDFYARPRAIARFMREPLGPYLETFADEMRLRGHNHAVVRVQLCFAARLKGSHRLQHGAGRGATTVHTGNGCGHRATCPPPRREGDESQDQNGPEGLSGISNGLSDPPFPFSWTQPVIC
jgi:hypothetical protein